MHHILFKRKTTMRKQTSKVRNDSSFELYLKCRPTMHTSAHDTFHQRELLRLLTV